ncbi:hypothetical protein ACLOJK_030689 [Asimina triloba]
MEEVRRISRRKRVYSFDPNAFLRASFPSKYVNHLFPALMDIIRRKKNDHQIQGHEIEKIVRFQVDMALAVSADGFSWSRALKRKLESSKEENPNSPLTFLLTSDEHYPHSSYIEVDLNCMLPPTAPLPKTLLPAYTHTKPNRNPKSANPMKKTNGVCRPCRSKRSTKASPEGDYMGLRLATLRRILPGGNEMGNSQLLSEVESYILCLELQSVEDLDNNPRSIMDRTAMGVTQPSRRVQRQNGAEPKDAKQLCYHRKARLSNSSASYKPLRPLLGISSNTSLPHEERSILESRIISVLQQSRSLPHLKHIHAHLLRIGLDQSNFVLAKLVRTLTNLDLPIDPYVRRLFYNVRYPNSFLYTALIRAYALRGPIPQSLLLYSCMRRLGSRPLSFTFSALFKACAALPDVGAGRQVHAQTISIGGFDSDLYVNNTLIDFYVSCGFLEDARRAFDLMPERDVISWTSMIVAYAKRGDMDAAEELFGGFPEKDMVAWTAMVTGFSQNGRPKDALRLFEMMQAAGVETDEVTVSGVISACAQLGALNHANWVRGVAERAGFGPSTNVVVGSALIDMYAKCGSVDEAQRVFEGMTERNVFSYSAMISGFAMHGKAETALSLFKMMVRETTVKPNGVTFIGVLTACSHAGMVEQGRKYFKSMYDDYGIAPSADHYASMVDLLSRAGHLEEAYELIKTMPIEPNGGVWGALLGACRIHGMPHVAEIAAGHLFELEPNGIGNYILLSNIYASAGMWDGVIRVRKLMRKKGLKKNPGCSWVESKDGIVHEFFAGDISHQRSDEIKAVLEELLKKLKQAGYLPKLRAVLYDVSDEEKERLLKNHSEKLALAFGLLTTSPGSAVRIMKNVRICEDCHSFICGVSLIEKREIVVRDNIRFHHFSDGACSCGDFW